jgi:hypothetical protein
VKATLTFIFSALLLIGQCILPESAVASAPQKCKRCDCGMKKCCVKTAAPESNQAPAAPAPARSLKQFQSPVILSTPIAASAASQSCQVFFPASTFRPAQAIPVYDRNCAWLI